MNENNVFLVEENQTRPPSNGANCNGHRKSIQAGGSGHWVGDSCGCDGVTPSVSINGYIPLLLIIAVVLIIKLTNRK